MLHAEVTDHELSFAHKTSLQTLQHTLSDLQPKLFKCHERFVVANGQIYLRLVRQQMSSYHFRSMSILSQ